ncbi:MAG: FAD-binding protein [Desulfobacterales bacterium]|nr:FAD-binding protein [Desulfobacterales bacterium]
MKNIQIEIVDADVLILGSGIAGLMAALEIAKKGKSSLVVSKAPIGKSNNTYLSGGYFGFAPEQKDMNAHIQKTMTGGREINNERFVRRFVEEAPGMVDDLLKKGLQGIIRDNGLLCIGETSMGGPAFMNFLTGCCNIPAIRVMENITATDLITDGSTCYGAVGHHKRSGKIFAFRANAVLMTTGGAGSIYSKNDNAPGATGDGYFLGMAAGLQALDMEFVQFYPLAYAGSGRSRMIVPPPFADLGKIQNRRGEDIKEKYSLFKKPVAIVSRDALSRALFNEIREGNDVDGALLLDMTQVDEKKITSHPKTLATLRKKFSFDKTPIRIIPACHHTMGGLVVEETCRTQVENLFAAGEIVGGIHGANRIGGNALTEAMVFGAIAGRSAAAAGRAVSLPDFKVLAQKIADKRFQPIYAGNTALAAVDSLSDELKRVLWEDAGIIRSDASLKNALARIEDITLAVTAMGSKDPWVILKIIECGFAALTGRAVALAALARTESRGSHYREDFPAEDPAWKKHIHMVMKDGRPEIV